jgi:hypothetical protein
MYRRVVVLDSVVVLLRVNDSVVVLVRVVLIVVLVSLPVIVLVLTEVSVIDMLVVVLVAEIVVPISTTRVQASVVVSTASNSPMGTLQ